MEVPKPSEEHKAAFRRLIPEAPTVQIKPMFGNLGAFVNGNMFAGLFGAALGVRVLDEARGAELRALAGTGPFGPAGRPMGGYVALPPEWVSAPELAEPWIAIALTDVAALPPKAPKKTG